MASGTRDAAQNRQASHNYFLLEKYEAGVALRGTEVKSIREGKANLKDAYGLIKDGEAFLLNAQPLAARTAQEWGVVAEVVATGKALSRARELAELYRRADGFIIVTAEYNQSVPPALKNLLDHFLEEYYWRPSAIVSYSASRYGGARAAVTLRTVLPEMGMSSVPSVLSIPTIHTGSIHSLRSALMTRSQPSKNAATCGHERASPIAYPKAPCGCGTDGRVSIN